MLRVVKLPSLVAKCCKIWKIYASEVCKFCTLLYYTFLFTQFCTNFVYFCITLTTKWPNFLQNLQTLKAYISHVLQYFATKRGSFTNFNMLFLVVVKDFDFFAKMKIQFKRGMVHC